ncbi:type VI secretion system baseplate subunit TssK [Neisseria dumasiana]|uniref:type VI secretion system baseplate subunit TssK n=1 Tax=Neisseria dumasiana TaxID=1931275 RepID=UPI00209C6D42|nr:type VI secretion system baseplate subunit TssK [Neisseria dumasiana]
MLLSRNDDYRLFFRNKAVVKIYKPLWEEGILLSPQHFQQQNQYNDFVAATMLKTTGAFNWGVVQQHLDHKALEVGKIKIDFIQLCLPDGIVLDTRLSNDIIEARPLDIIPESAKNVLVYLAVPIWQSHTSNLSGKQDTAGAPRRFKKYFETVSDLFSDEEVEIAVEQYNLQIRFDFEDNDNYILCPVARLSKNEHGKFTFDSRYVPPSVLLESSPYLVELLQRLKSLLFSRIHSLSARRKARSEDLVDFSVSDSTLFWFLHSLNSVYPEISHLELHPNHHPEELYKLMCRLLGMLYTFRISESVENIDNYDHLNLYKTFNNLEIKIRDLLDEVIPSPVIEISLDHFKPTQWRAQIFDSRIDGSAEFFLSAHSETLSFLDLQKQLPLVSKVGAPDDVERVINTAVLGVPLQLLNQAPAGLPVRMDNVYFRLDKNHPAFKRMLESQAFSIYVPASVTNLRLSLYAVVNL